MKFKAFALLWASILGVFALCSLFVYQNYEISLCHMAVPFREEIDKDLSNYDSLDYGLEDTLPFAFRRALDTHPAVPPDQVKIVFVVSYYRSGSTFVTELLTAAPKTFCFFEPFVMFTINGRVSPRWQRSAFKFLDELTLCRLWNVPLYVLWMHNSSDFWLHNPLLADVCGAGKACYSPTNVGLLCTRAHTQVFKFTRLYVHQVKRWMEHKPDIAKRVRVVHLVRDPRAIYASRRGLDWCSDNWACYSPEAICGQLRADLDAFEKLAAEIGDTRAIRLRFEDLAVNLVDETKRLYAKLGLEYTPSVSKFLEEHAKASQEDLQDAYSTNRRNTSAIADAWKRKLSIEQIKSIQQTCNDTLLRLGYKFM